MGDEERDGEIERQKIKRGREKGREREGETWGDRYRKID